VMEVGEGRGVGGGDGRGQKVVGGRKEGGELGEGGKVVSHTVGGGNMYLYSGKDSETSEGEEKNSYILSSNR